MGHPCLLLQMPFTRNKQQRGLMWFYLLPVIQAGSWGIKAQPWARLFAREGLCTSSRRQE